MPVRADILNTKLISCYMYPVSVCDIFSFLHSSDSCRRQFPSGQFTKLTFNICYGLFGVTNKALEGVTLDSGKIITAAQTRNYRLLQSHYLVMKIIISCSQLPLLKVKQIEGNE